jgi:hypothetical protein
MAALVAVIILVIQQSRVGGVEGLLQVGEDSPVRPLLEEQLGTVPLAEGTGHDGQIYYAIALDLRGEEVAPLMDHGIYRYRRIMYPAVASLGGFLDGKALLFSMIAVTVVSFGVAAGCVAALSVRSGHSDWLALFVILNPGLWLSVRLLTGDVMALGLMVLALLLVVLRSRWPSLAFAASVLTKDVYLVTPGALMVDRHTRRWSLLFWPLAALSLWTIYASVNVGGGFTEAGNITWPFLGIVQAASNWSDLGSGDVFYLAFSLVSVAVGLVYGTLRAGWMRWPILAWSILGVVSSSWVWDFGNNAARAFAPILVLVGVSLATQQRDVDDRLKIGVPPPAN